MIVREHNASFKIVLNIWIMAINKKTKPRQSIELVCMIKSERIPRSC